MNDAPHPIDVPAGWLEALAESEAELAASLTVPASVVHQRIRDTIARIEVSRAAVRNTDTIVTISPARCASLAKVNKPVIPRAIISDVPASLPRHAGESRYPRFRADSDLQDLDTGFRRHDELGAAHVSIVRAPGITLPVIVHDGD